MFARMTELKWMLLSGLALVASQTLVFAGAARAESHEYIMMMRSSAETHVFVSQAVEGTYGLFKRNSAGVEKSAAAISPSGSSSATWQGYEMKTTVGLELKKFISFSLGHNTVTLRSKDDGSENIRGSKLAGESKLSFMSPMGNLEFGGAVTGSRYDYQNGPASGGYFGSGYYYLIGWNYFLSHRLSLFGSAKLTQEHLVPNGGEESLPAMDTNMTSLGGGFSLWL